MTFLGTEVPRGGLHLLDPPSCSGADTTLWPQDKEEGGLNHITIEPGNGGTITDPTVWKKKEKRGFWNRFSFGPGVTAGYDPINKRFGVVVGASAIFDLK